MNTTIADVMTSTPVQIEPDTSVAEAAQLMRDNDIGDVLIVEGDRLRGLVTDRDLAIRVLADGNGPDTPVREVCTEEPVTVSPEDDVESALELMRAHAVRRVPVVENGMPVGMVSLGDLATTREPESVLGEISQAIPNQ